VQYSILDIFPKIYYNLFIKRKEIKIMAITIWMIRDENTHKETELIYYHFGKTPRFPSSYLKENHSYIIKMIWNMELRTFKGFFRCLMHLQTIRSVKKYIS
jgi:hypothetical protein